MFVFSMFDIYRELVRSYQTLGADGASIGHCGLRCLAKLYEYQTAVDGDGGAAWAEFAVSASCSIITFHCGAG
jgi:hypothetical protein